MKRNDEELMTPGEVADYLHVCRSTVSRIFRSGDLPVYYISRRRRCRKSDLMAWLENQVTTEENKEL